MPIKQAFADCGSLQEITIPAGVTLIGDYAFNGCSSLASVNFEDGSKLTSIGERAFGWCNLQEITIPASVTSIGRYAFYGCSKLEKFIVDASNKSYSSQDGVLYDKAQTQIILVPKAIKVAVPFLQT